MSFIIQGIYRIDDQQKIKGRLTIDISPEYHDIVRRYLKQKLSGRKEIKLALVFNPDVTKRNLDQNALMHVWYSIECMVLNAGTGGSGKHELKPWDLYENDLKEYCPKEEILVKREFLNMYKRKFRHTHILEEEEEYIRIQIWKTSSHFTVREMAYWVQRIINRVADYGIPVDSMQTGIKGEWIDFQKWLSKNKIILHSEESCTREEYKAKVPVCEASGIWLGSGGEVAHIQHTGMGGNEEPEKDHPGNWFHLSTEIHREIIHGRGWKCFLKTYPWLRYKYNLAMNLQEGKE